MSEDLKGLSLVDLYDRLAFPDAPVPVSMWPQTSGWLWLGFAVLCLVLFVVWRVAAWRQATAYRRAALVALREAGDDPAAITNVLKRTALAGFPRARVAALYGDDWLAFLDKTAPSGGFVGSDAGKALAAAPYRAQTTQAGLSAMAEAWIRTHRQDGVR